MAKQTLSRLLLSTVLEFWHSGEAPTLDGLADVLIGPGGFKSRKGLAKRIWVLRKDGLLGPSVEAAIRKWDGKGLFVTIRGRGVLSD